VLDQRKARIVEREIGRRLRAGTARGQRAGKDDGGGEDAKGW
jgi:hypothetical protein